MLRTQLQTLSMQSLRAPGPLSCKVLAARSRTCLVTRQRGQMARMTRRRKPLQILQLWRRRGGQPSK